MPLVFKLPERKSTQLLGVTRLSFLCLLVAAVAGLPLIAAIPGLPQRLVANDLAPLTVTGTVTDEAGKPIAGAVVRARFRNSLSKSNTIRQAVTGGDGVYHVDGREPGMALVAVRAKDRGIDMREVLIEHGMSQVSFQLNPGRTVRIRVLDERNHPIPKASVELFWPLEDEPGSIKLDDVIPDVANPGTDERGMWEFREAAARELYLSINRPGAMRTIVPSVTPRREEYIFHPPPALVISGKVIDKESRWPIEHFRVVPGGHASANEWKWWRNDSREGVHGRYRISEATSYAFDHIVRIEADGYRPVVSRDMTNNEGNVALDFELIKGQDLDAVVVSPAGRPAVKSKVAIGIDGSEIRIRNGEIDPQTNAAFQEADAGGRFHFPPQLPGYFLVITHPSGYAVYRPALRSNPRVINLDPWTRVEGTYRALGKSIGNVPIETSVSLVPNEDGYPQMDSRCDATTGSNGHFVFERMFAGRGTIGRRFDQTTEGLATDAVAARGTACLQIRSTFPAGKTVHIDLGRVGQSVIGKLNPPAGWKKQVFWNFASVCAQAEPDDLPTRNFQFTARVSRDGTFRIDDMPPGIYSLRVSFARYEPGRLGWTFFSIPMTDRPTPEKPIDVGVLPLISR